MEAMTPPPNLPPGRNLAGRLYNRLRRLLDLQVTSVLRELVPWLSRRTGTLLEVGCGAQPYRHHVPSHCAYVGLDWHQSGSVFGYRESGVVLFDGKTFPLRTGSVDSLFHTEVLEHVRDPGFFLGECQRVLKPHGEMFLSVPFQARYHYIPHDYWRFTPAGLELLLRRAGFENIVVLPRGSDITVAAYKLVCLCYRGLLCGRWPGKLLGLAFAPIAGTALVIGQISLCCGGGSPDDCLGYNVRATKGMDCAKEGSLV